MDRFKNCKHCGARMDRTSNICPNCGKKQIKPSFIIGLYILLVPLCIAVVLLSAKNGASKTGTNTEISGVGTSQGNSLNQSSDYSDETNTNSSGYESSAQSEVSYEAELILMQIAEDMAKQVAKNPGTVEFKDWYWGFAREGTNYAVQGTFECSNLLGVSEEHDIQVWCEASTDYSKIKPYAVYLDGEKIA